jgi:hypothetical protein
MSQTQCCKYSDYFFLDSSEQKIIMCVKKMVRGEIIKFEEFSYKCKSKFNPCCYVGAVKLKHLSGST